MSTNNQVNLIDIVNQIDMLCAKVQAEQNMLYNALKAKGANVSKTDNIPSLIEKIDSFAKLPSTVTLNHQNLKVGNSAPVSTVGDNTNCINSTVVTFPMAQGSTTEPVFDISMLEDGVTYNIKVNHHNTNMLPIGLFNLSKGGVSLSSTTAFDSNKKITFKSFFGNGSEAWTVNESSAPITKTSSDKYLVFKNDESFMEYDQYIDYIEFVPVV